MDLEGLTFGVGSILRDQVSGWATSDSGTPHVYPDHPPLDLAKSSYPRATVDTIGFNPTEEDIDKTVFVGDQLMDVTVYGINSQEVNALLGDSVQAIIDYHDADDANGDPYLDGFALQQFGITGPIFDEETDKGFTRYSKTQEVAFESITTKSV